MLGFFVVRLRPEKGTTYMDEQTYTQGSIALDPFRPNDILTPPGMEKLPPFCPVCENRLEPVRQNPEGDILFECLADGYMAAWRKTAQVFERPKNFPEAVSPWKAPKWETGEVEKQEPQPPAPVAATPSTQTGVTALDAALLSGIAPDVMAAMIRNGQVQVIELSDGSVRVPVSELMKLGGK